MFGTGKCDGAVPRKEYSPKILSIGVPQKLRYELSPTDTILFRCLSCVFFLSSSVAHDYTSLLAAMLCPIRLASEGRWCREGKSDLSQHGLGKAALARTGELDPDAG